MIDNIKSQMRKGMLEYCILTIIGSRKEAYTADVLKCLKESNLIVVEGTIYPLLSRMKNAGLLSYRWQESNEGPPRKYFCITAKGRELLAELNQEWILIRDSINDITQTV